MRLEKVDKRGTRESLSVKLFGDNQRSINFFPVCPRTTFYLIPRATSQIAHTRHILHWRQNGDHIALS